MLSTIILISMAKTTIPQLSYNLVELEDLLPGDHIFRYGALFKNSLLTHHGIYIGDRKIIHFSGGSNDSKSLQDYEDDMKSAKIEITSFRDFMNSNNKCFKVNGYLTDSERTQILERSYSKLNTNFDYGYCPTTNNCEHFANWCSTGIRISKQTDFITTNIGKLLNLSEEKKNKLNNILTDVKLIIEPLQDIPKLKLAKTIVKTLDKFIN